MSIRKEWRAIPFVELDATADKWLMVDQNGSWLDNSAEAQRKRTELNEYIAMPLFDSQPNEVAQFTTSKAIPRRVEPI